MIPTGFFVPAGRRRACMPVKNGCMRKQTAAGRPISNKELKHIGNQRVNLKLSHIDKSYDDSKTKRVIFKDMSATLVAGKISVIIGKSGVGKSSLLNLISGIDLPDRGTIHVGDLCISDFDDSERTIFRRR